MTVDAAATQVKAEQPQLVVFVSAASGRCRRVEGFLAQVLQRRGNHRTFRVYRVDADSNAELADHFKVSALPTLVVVEKKRVRASLPDPRGCGDIERFLRPWLR